MNGKKARAIRNTVKTMYKKDPAEKSYKRINEKTKVVKDFDGNIKFRYETYTLVLENFCGREVYKNLKKAVINAA